MSIKSLAACEVLPNYELRCHSHFARFWPHVALGGCSREKFPTEKMVRWGQRATKRNFESFENVAKIQS